MSREWAQKSGSYGAPDPHSWLSPSHVFDAQIKMVSKLPGTHTHTLLLQSAGHNDGDEIELIVHQKYFELLNGQQPILAKGRGVRLVGCKSLEMDGRFRLLPTEYAAVVLDEGDDSDFLLISTLFSDHSLSEICVEVAMAEKEFFFYVKVLSISQVYAAQDVRHLHKQVVEITDDSISGKSVSFIFWDDQMVATHLFKPGDFLAIQRPFLSPRKDKRGELYLEYGSATILFVTPVSEQQEHVQISSQLSQQTMSVPKDIEGVLDFTSVSQRMYTSDVQPNSRNITLVGYVEKVSQNKPMAGLESRDRHAVRIRDRSGTLDITFWGSEYESVLGQCCPGHLVCIQNLSSSERGDGGKFFVSANPYNNARIYNINMMPGLLSTPPLCFPKWIGDARHLRTSFTCRAAILNYHKYGPTPVVNLDSRCRRPIADGDETCPFCCKFVNQRELGYHILWSIDDGTFSISATAMPDASMEIMGIPAQDFSCLSEGDQQRRMDETILLEFIFLVTKYRSSNGQHHYRIDRATKTNSQAEAHRLLAKLR